MVSPTASLLVAAERDVPGMSGTTSAPYVSQTSQPADSPPLGLQVGDRVL